MIPINNELLVGENDFVSAKMQFVDGENGFSINIKIKNISNLAIPRVFLRLGIDSYMCSYPEWNEQYFPTLLRCERTHFYGYYSTPTGKILALASPDPVISWSHDYNIAIYGNQKHVGHRIYTSCLDLINGYPQPEHHPQSSVFNPGEVCILHLTLRKFNSLDEFSGFVAEITDAPTINLKKYTLEIGEKLLLESDSTCRFFSDNGTEVFNKSSLTINPGRYIITAKRDSKISETSVYVRKDWSWYLIQAARAAQYAPQKASTHMESWLGYFSAFYAALYYPEYSNLDVLLDDFNKTFSLMMNLETGELYDFCDPNRIQNISMAVSLLTLVYRVCKDEKYLLCASKLADRIISLQSEDGAYRSYNVHYTCVSYIAKSLMEYYEVAINLPDFADSAQKCRDSICAAIKNLVELEDNIQTEGEITFEDGMISCEVLQLALFALQFPELSDERIVSLAEKLLRKHRCLEQQNVPDCRQRGCTIRFWESMYDVLIQRNFINSPHGWTAWKVYGTYYLYLLTGKLEYLIDTFDTLGACVQCVDINSGKLRWGFISDPCVCAEVLYQREWRKFGKKVFG